MRKIGLLLVALAVSACSSGGGGGDAVSMAEGQRFEPQSLTVAPGTTVTFTNDSAEAHTVTAYEGAPEYFSSGGFGTEEQARDNLADAMIGQDGTYEFTFDEPGTYEYFCIPHEQQGMKGTIVVEE